MAGADGSRILEPRLSTSLEPLLSAPGNYTQTGNATVKKGEILYEGHHTRATEVLLLLVTFLSLSVYMPVYCTGL